MCPKEALCSFLLLDFEIYLLHLKKTDLPKLDKFLFHRPICIEFLYTHFLVVSYLILQLV